MKLLTFIIPIKHKDNIKDKDKFMSNLSQTISSICNQTNTNWNAVIVVNKETPLPYIPPEIYVKYVDLPSNKFYEKDSSNDVKKFQDAVKLDKGTRVLEGIKHVSDSMYYMVVDDDDLISCNITQFVYENSDNLGWVIKYGYLWNDCGKILYKINDFNNLCGTSLIIRSDLYKLIGVNENISINCIKNVLGSHIDITEILQKKEIILDELPFRGAIYRVGHACSHSKNKKIWRHFFKIKLLINPLLLFKEILKIRWLTERIRGTFF
ncbi:hypothetical protein [Acinetobacter sp. AND/436]|uniref:hypothetical protein n=1 Tax=Acinetobacter sp. AND/436 TaxID=3414736 RepID=UPI003C308B24